MKTRKIFCFSAGLVLIGALLFFAVRKSASENASRNQPVETSDVRKRKDHPSSGTPGTPRPLSDYEAARIKYKEEIRGRFLSDGLAANLKDTVGKPMSDYLRQDLFIQLITLSLEKDGLEKTVDEILAGLEAGVQRDGCILLAFVNAKDDLPTLHRKLMDLEGEEERRSATEGIRSVIADRDVRLADLLKIFPEPFLREAVLAGSAGASGSPLNPTADRGKFIDRNVSDLVDAIRQGTVEKGAIGRFVRDASITASGQASFHLWNSINSSERMEGLSIHPTTYKKLVNSMMSTDSPRTFSLLAESKVGLPPDVISESAKNWLNHQNVQPVEWLKTEGRDFDPAFKDAFISGLIDYNLEKGGVDESRQWSAQIQDPDLKRRLEQKIEGRSKR